MAKINLDVNKEVKVLAKQLKTIIETDKNVTADDLIEVKKMLEDLVDYHSKEINDYTVNRTDFRHCGARMCDYVADELKRDVAKYKYLMSIIDNHLTAITKNGDGTIV